MTAILNTLIFPFPVDGDRFLYFLIVSHNLCLPLLPSATFQRYFPYIKNNTVMMNINRGKSLRFACLTMTPQSTK